MNNGKIGNMVELGIKVKKLLLKKKKNMDRQNLALLVGELFFVK